MNSPAAVSLCLALLTASLPATAAQAPVKVLRTVPYLDGVGTQEVREECTWNTTLVDTLVKVSRGNVTVTDADLAAEPGRVLVLNVTAVHGAAMFAGPNWARIKGELREGGQVLGRFEATSHSMSPFHATACGMLEKVGKQLGVTAAKWLRKPVNNAKVGDGDGTTAQPDRPAPVTPPESDLPMPQLAEPAVAPPAPAP